MLPTRETLLLRTVIESGKLALAKELGLVKTDEHTQTAYDFFRDRLLFPIQNFYGEIIGFGGRVSKEADRKYAKYLNSKESNIYTKEKVLYGLYQAKGEIRKQNRVLLVEGYADVISLHQAGITTAVATCGTALTQSHVQALTRLCSHVVIWRDGDAAGYRASVKDIDILVKSGCKVSIVCSPESKDPDDMAREKGKDLPGWIEKNIQDALLWKALKLKAQAENPDEISRATHEICYTLSYIQDEVKSSCPHL